MLPRFATKKPERRWKTTVSVPLTRLLTLRKCTLLFLVIGATVLLVRWTLAPDPLLQCIAQRDMNNGSSFIHPGSLISYRIFLHDAGKSPAQPHHPIASPNDLSQDCLDTYLARGGLCRPSHSTNKLDIVWTWVNGSDPLIQNAMDEMSSAQLHHPQRGAREGTMAKLFRDHDELRYSIRSVMQHFGPHVGSAHVVAPDLEVTFCEQDASPNRRIGQIPNWIDEVKMEGLESSETSLRLWHHAQIFQRYNQSIFNSLAIETQLINVPGLSENFIYLNDDIFFSKDLKPFDFYTSYFGPVLRMQSDLLVKPHRDSLSAPIEWLALEYTNGLLSDRFGARYRPYTVHQAKTLSSSILREVSLIWSAEILPTSSRPFRGMSGRTGDLYMVFLATHYIVERWREGLLWSWVVGKIGQLDGSWGDAESDRAWKEIGGSKGEAEIKIIRGERETLGPAQLSKVFKDEGYYGAGEGKPQTKYVFSSADGFPYTGFGRRGSRAWLPDARSNDPGKRCTIQFNDCFSTTVDDGHALQAEDVFKRVAFIHSSTCGDCIITALVKASGHLGLSAFLPDSDRVFRSGPPRTDPPERRERDVPVLPLTLNWWETNFSFETVLRPYALPEASATPINVRKWVTRMLQRYRFVIGETPSNFVRMLNPEGTRQMLLRADSKDPALICVNDDVGFGDDLVREYLITWMQNKWSTPSKWEKEL